MRTFADISWISDVSRAACASFKSAEGGSEKARNFLECLREKHASSIVQGAMRPSMLGKDEFEVMVAALCSLSDGGAIAADLGVARESIVGFVSRWRSEEVVLTRERHEELWRFIIVCSLVIVLIAMFFGAWMAIAELRIGHRVLGCIGLIVFVIPVCQGLKILRYDRFVVTFRGGAPVCLARGVFGDTLVDVDIDGSSFWRPSELPSNSIVRVAVSVSAESAPADVASFWFRIPSN